MHSAKSATEWLSYFEAAGTSFLKHSSNLGIGEGAMVRAPASHPYGLGSFPRPGATCRLSYC